MSPVLDKQLKQLRDAGLEVESQATPSGAVVVTIRGLPLPDGWSLKSTDIHFVAPNGYPFSQPDCFWADPRLELEKGLAPQATQKQAVPETGLPATWFSWHVMHWNPNTDSLLSFYRLIRQRLQDPK
jgi:Prokaryotic E2 family E